MARTQAADYGERRQAILEKAAELYAERGFQGASVADLAERLRMSKSLIYHYYPSKEDILFDVMHSHVQALLEAAEAVVARDGPASAKLDALTHDFMRLYVGAASRHKVLLNELARLPLKQREIVVRIQRRLIDIVEQLVAEIRPDLRAKRPAAMLYFGMINWTHTWLDPDGKVAPSKVASLANTIFLDGLTRGDV
jgi:AcrR family transcriptional regulator